MPDVFNVLIYECLFTSLSTCIIDSDLSNALLICLVALGAEFLDSVGHAGSVLSRWCASLEAFSRHFPEDVGAEHRSYMCELGRFPEKEARFRKEMERLRNAARRDLTLEVSGSLTLPLKSIYIRKM